MSMKRVLSLSLFLLPGLSLHGAEPDATADNQTQAAASAEDARMAETASTDNPSSTQELPTTTDDDGLTRPSDEDFVPSVQISEDLSVSFPVDI